MLLLGGPAKIGGCIRSHSACLGGQLVGACRHVGGSRKAQPVGEERIGSVSLHQLDGVPVVAISMIIAVAPGLCRQ
jgi:hypothetical protein